MECRRKHGLTDDILSALLAAEVDGEKLNRDQLNEFFLLLAIAGNETTRNTLSHGILALSGHPDQRALLAGRPDAIKPAVEELLRWATPVMDFRAHALPVGQPGRGGVRRRRTVRRHAPGRGPRRIRRRGCISASARSWPVSNCACCWRSCVRTCRL
ncbi:hypothetical protein [Mycobacterium sp. 050134]|uniref:hypothetical protein n=1 Tax=Mycobacterium sp. 050134 TaxID=3096111 RepID=UPI002ED91FB3